MKCVKITFIDFQSYKDTKFSLYPGLNVIWSKGNNVGKSSIIRALEAITRIHKYSGQQIKDLIRWGQPVAYIVCEYDNCRTELKLFLRNSTASYSFSHYEDDDFIEMDRAPKVLLDALSIFYDEEIDYILNIIEADKVQVIVDETSLTEGIMSSILFDAKLEEIKENADALCRKINDDYSFYSYNLNLNKKNLEGKSYNTIVDTFNSEKNILYLLSDIIDTFPNYSQLKNFVNLDLQQPNIILNNIVLLDYIYKKIQLLENPSVSINTELLNILLVLYKNIKILYVFYSSKIAKETFNLHILSLSLQYLTYINKLLNLIVSYTNTTVSLDSISNLIKEKRNKLLQLGDIINCPIKGKVVYSDEKCIPYIE